MVFWSVEERLRREAARWFGRMRGSNAFRHNRRFKAWLDADPRHRATYERLVSRWDASYLLTQSETVESYLRPSASRSGGPARIALALAALILAIAALGLALLIGVHARSHAVELASAIGQRRTLVLADGSRLVLDADSAVSPEITAGRRTVRLLRGRARFAVANAVAPFVVLAGDAVVTAHGTEFDVDRVAADQVDIVLIQGAVDIARRRPLSLLGPERLLRLSGHERASLRKAAILVSPRGEPASAQDWTVGPLSFVQTPMGEALVEANRYSLRKIRLASPDLATLQITGVFDKEASGDLAQGLARALDLSLATSPNGDWVLSRRAA